MVEQVDPSEPLTAVNIHHQNSLRKNYGLVVFMQLRIYISSKASSILHLKIPQWYPFEAYLYLF